MLKLVLLIIFLASPALAEELDPVRFCETTLSLQSREKAETPSPGQLLTLALFPGRVIRSEQVNRPFPAGRRAPGKKQVLILLPDPGVDEAELRAFHRARKRLKRLPLVHALSRVSDLGECIRMVNQDSFGFARVQEGLRGYERIQPMLEAQRQSRMRRILEQKLRPFVSRGWEKWGIPDGFALMDHLKRNPDVTEIMIIAHADEAGNLYDARGSVIPRGFLFNLPPGLRKVILFSCHSEAVLERYEAPRAAHHLDIHYPALRRGYHRLYRTSIPLIAMEGMLESADSGILSLPPVPRNCRLEMDLPAPAGRLLILLNDRWIAVTSRESRFRTSFDCTLLSAGKNIFKIHHPDGEPRIPPRISEMRLQTPDQGILPLRVREFVSTDGESHIQTIGTVGGNP